MLINGQLNIIKDQEHLTDKKRKNILKILIKNWLIMFGLIMKNAIKNKMNVITQLHQLLIKKEQMTEKNGYKIIIQKALF